MCTLIGKKMIDEKEIIRRRDMRDVFTFTIDPADAKDFDDAISFECLTAKRSVSKAVCQRLRSSKSESTSQTSLSMSARIRKSMTKPTSAEHPSISWTVSFLCSPKSFVTTNVRSNPERTNSSCPSSLPWMPRRMYSSIKSAELSSAPMFG